MKDTFYKQIEEESFESQPSVGQVQTSIDEQQNEDSIQNLKFKSLNRTPLRTQVIFDRAEVARESAKTRQVSISQYMYKNIHMLGFQNKSRVLNVAIRELMDNSLDAANQNYMLPKIDCKISPIKKGYKLIFKDYGPGIVPKDVSNVCGKLLYGSKFESGSSQRGSQGIGLTSLVLYSQKTKGCATKIITKTKNCAIATQVDLKINVAKNRPEVISKKKNTTCYKQDETGFCIELDLLASYTKSGSKSTVDFIKQYCYLNPNLELTYSGPEEGAVVNERISHVPLNISTKCKIVPHQMQVGDMLNLMEKYPKISLKSLVHSYFEGPLDTYLDLFLSMGLPSSLKCEHLNLKIINKLVTNFYSYFKDLKPHPSQLVNLGPIIKETVTHKNEILFDNVINVTSDPIYLNKGVLQVELSAFCGGPGAEDTKFEVYRVANGTPLLYMGPSCCITRSIIEHNWKRMGFIHIQNELPRGKMVLFVHLNGTTMPYINQSKDAIAQLQPIKLLLGRAFTELGKKLSTYIKRCKLYEAIAQKNKIVSKVVPELLISLKQGLHRAEDLLTKQDTRNLKGLILQMVSIYRTPQQLTFYNHKYPTINFSIYNNLESKYIHLEYGKSCTVDWKGPFSTEGILNIDYLNLID